jgi:carbon-monoxide dehydrogenase large subunit
MSIGRPVPRLEDDRLLRGRGRFTDDEPAPDAAWCAFVRSPHAHARVMRIDASAAAGMPGVYGVLTGRDYRADGLRPVDHVPNPLSLYDIERRAFDDPVQRPHWPLAEGEVRHVGEPVAAVVAATAAQARDAADEVEVAYAPLEPDEQLCLEAKSGDEEAVGRAFAQAALVVRRNFRHQRVANAQLEPRSAIGRFADGAFTLVTGSQGVMLLKQLLAKVLGTDAVRVITRDVGGGFGPRTYLQPEQIVVLWSAKRFGRPVRWTSERSEAFASDFQGRDAAIDAALALDERGRILAYRVELDANIGAHTVSFVPPSNFRNVLTTAYRIPAAHLAIRARTSNSPPTVPYRGAGRPEAHHAIERLLDIAARRLGLDRAEIRRRNVVTRDELPYRNPMGLAMDAVDFPGYLERGLALARWHDFPQRRAESRARAKLRGIGLAMYVESPVGAPFERVSLDVSADGVRITAGTQSTGQGHETTFAQVVADKLGVPLATVWLKTGDTESVAAGGGTHSDRSMRYVGNLAVRACERIIELGREAAAARLEAHPEDLVFERAQFRVAGTDRRIALLELAPLSAREELRARIPAYPGGCAVCEVEVDPETGAAKVVDYTTIDDVGQPINPLVVHGQTHGGIAQGVGQALAEGVVYGEDRQILTGSWMDYAMLRAEHLPDLRGELVEEPTPGNELRVKGGGEGGIVPATAAVINALCDALEVEDIAMPATSFAVWKALQEKKEEL